jgi:ABC-type lipopolysaccharide export system ATPase subunit
MATAYHASLSTSDHTGMLSYNVEERKQQASRMQQIYEDCTRVVVHLGPDVAIETSTFSKHRSLDQMDPTSQQRATISSAEIQSLELLGRAYFGRVWVKQELSVSSRAIIRSGNIDYRAMQASWNALVRTFLETSIGRR